MANNPFSFFPLPGSGPVTQDLLDHWFSPAVTYNFAGDATIEKQVVESVASYGRQIGWLNEVVLALAEAWGGLALAYWTDWPTSFWITALSAAVYALSLLKA